MKLSFRKNISNQQDKTDNAFREQTIILLMIIMLFTVVHWSILISLNPILMYLPYWFFPIHEQTIYSYWIGLAVAILGLSMIVSFSHVKTLTKLCLIILFGAAIQLSIGFSQGKGLEGVRQNMVNTGHAEFARLAVQQRSMLDVAMHYESKVENGELIGFAASKPPGTLLFYMLFERLANLGANNLDPVQHMENLTTFASLIWPIISYFVVIPIWILGKMIIDEDGAMTACLLYLSIPSVNLITLHLDQVIFPLLAVIPVALIALSYARRKTWLAILGGVAFYVAIYFSFGLLFVAVIIMMVFVVIFLKSPSMNRLLKLRFLGITLASVVISDLLMRLFVHYDIATRYANALANHVNSRGWDFNIGTYMGASITNLAEFSVWLGIPIVIIFLGAIFSSTNQVMTDKKISPYSGLAFALVLIFILLLLFGQTKGETARLWMFLIPYICILAAGFIHSRRLSYKIGRFTIIGLVLILEFGTTCLTLWHQNFL
jgi:hypothetical protein